MPRLPPPFGPDCAWCGHVVDVDGDDATDVYDADGAPLKCHRACAARAQDRLDEAAALDEDDHEDDDDEDEDDKDHEEHDNHEDHEGDDEDHEDHEGDDDDEDGEDA